MATSFASIASSKLSTFGALNFVAEYTMLVFAVFLFVTGFLGKEQKNRIAAYKGATPDEQNKKASMADFVYRINDATTYIGVAALVAMACFFAGKVRRDGGKLRLEYGGTSAGALNKVQLGAFITVFAWEIFVLAENLVVYKDVASWKQSDKGCPPPQPVLARTATGELVSDEGAAKTAKTYYDTFIAFIVISIVFFSLVVAARFSPRLSGGGDGSSFGKRSVSTASSTNAGSSWTQPIYRSAPVQSSSFASSQPSYISKFGAFA